MLGWYREISDIEVVESSRADDHLMSGAVDGLQRQGAHQFANQPSHTASLLVGHKLILNIENGIIISYIYGIGV